METDQYQVVVLREGYSTMDERGRTKANGTISLIRGRGRNVIVDTGSPNDKDVILQGLTNNNLTPNDINYCVTTHGHPDHCGNINLFTKAQHVFGNHVFRGDVYVAHDFLEGIPYEIDNDDLYVIASPGHCLDDIAIVVRNTPDGIVCIAGDLFEREEDILLTPELWRRNSGNETIQALSRARILNIADVIVPGHGPAFTVREEYRRAAESENAVTEECSP